MAQENRHLVQKHSFWEVMDGNLAQFLEDAWQKIPKRSEITNLGTLNQRLISNNQENVRDMWEPNHTSTQFRVWKSKEWWKEQGQGANLHRFYDHLKERLILMAEGPEKVRWGYTNSGNFNIIEALDL